MHTTITTPFTDQLIDHDTHSGIDHGAALATTTFFSGTGLVINDDRTAFDFSELTLNGIQFIAVVNSYSFGKCNPVVFLGFVGNHLNFDGTFCTHALCNLNHRMTFCAFTHTLSTGHGNRIVVQNFVGDVDPGSNALTNGQNAAVKISPITDVGKHMFFIAEMLLTNPGCSFAAHLGKAHGAAIHPQTHEVTANACHGARPLRHFGTGVVWATRAKPRHAIGIRVQRQTVL